MYLLKKGLALFAVIGCTDEAKYLDMPDSHVAKGTNTTGSFAVWKTCKSFFQINHKAFKWCNNYFIVLILSHP